MLDPIEQRLIAAYRDRVRSLGFRPMSARGAAEAWKDYRAGEENNRIEGLHATPEDRAFAAMLIEEGVPTELWAGLGADYARALVAARNGEASG
jgi:hypothetical protein